MNLLTNLDYCSNLILLLYKADGICSPVSIGAIAMRRKVHGFFNALKVYDGWYMGKPQGLPVQYPVCKPDISSIALIFNFGTAVLAVLNLIPESGQSTYRNSIMTNSIKQKTSLYRHYDADNQLLYVGISISYVDRFESHKLTSEWAFQSVRIDTQWFDSREEALAAEKHAIEHEHPKYNKIHSKINRQHKVNLSVTSEIFQFQNHPLRIFTDQDGNPWFIAKDVAEILEYSDAYEMTKKLDDDEKSNRQIAGLGPGTGGKGITLINESGLYASVITSKKPEAKTFRRWVTHEVLPSIRKTGSYTKQPKEFIPSDRSIKQTPIPKIETKKLWYITDEEERLERLEWLEQMANKNPADIPLLIKLFIKDWQSGKMGAPFVSCLGAQTIELFYRWVYKNYDFEDQKIIDQSEIMIELYKDSMFDRQKYYFENKTGNYRIMTMINNQKPSDGQSFHDYIIESIQKIAKYLAT